MDATVSIILALLVGVALGALIGWLYAGRDAAAARQTVDSLRLQLDEVVRERDANRSAAHDLAAVRAAQEERERAFEDKIAELVRAREELSAQFEPLRRSASRPVASQTSAQSRHTRMHCVMSIISATHASAQLAHILAQYIRWWTASPSGWLTCSPARGWRAIILRMDMVSLPRRRSERIHSPFRGRLEKRPAEG